MIARVRTSVIFGLEAIPVDVEVEVSRGRQEFALIGLGDSAVREARDRVLSALAHSGFELPEKSLINLAPAEVKKEGSSLDVPIALGILVASGQLAAAATARRVFYGELSLDGTIKPIRGVIAHAVLARRSGTDEIVVPLRNFPEAALVRNLRVVAARNLLELVAALEGRVSLETSSCDLGCPSCDAAVRAPQLSEVYGQESAKRALLIAAAGGHNLLMVGPPGCGKSMLAERFPAILPPLTEEEALEVVQIHSVSGHAVDRLLDGARPYRSPHHVISDVGLVGGGTHVRPGEASLAHRGVLFLDEFPEFRRSALEALRSPLESGSIVVTRAKGSVRFPARFQLLAAMNPCPCGRLGAEGQVCACSPGAVHSYLRKLSQPILERIDIHVELSRVPLAKMQVTREVQVASEEDYYPARVNFARQRQLERAGKINGELCSSELGKRLRIADHALRFLEQVAERQLLSARAYTRILRVATTIADLEDASLVNEAHVAEAIGFRCLERLERYCHGNFTGSFGRTP